jgi:polar amino acid transport system substrate-binding protein
MVGRVARVARAGALVIAIGLGAAAGAQEPAQFRWAADPEGGAPFVEASPDNPNVLVGFDVEIADLIARGLNRSPRFVFVQFASIDQSVARGDAEIGLNGIEDTPARRATLSVTLPYYRFREVLSVRDGDASRFRVLRDLAGRRVGTLAGTIAYEILLKAQQDHGLVPVSYDDDVHPYTDLLEGRLDGVLLDNVLADRRQKTMTGFTTQPDSVATGHYVGVLAASNAPLRDSINGILLTAMRDGTLERIFRKWGVWNADQPVLYERILSGEAVEPVIGVELESVATLPWWRAALQYLPPLVRASAITLVLSCLSMGLAVALGVLIASGRVYGTRLPRLLLVGYVELIRGTPLLLQLFVLYYGIASAVRLPAFAAALLGLAFNYAAYESEIYRAALEAVPRGQLEAARTLGLSEMQVLRFIRGPQAFRLALAPMTNDFVALLKDSSLVSVLTVMELTKQTQVFATNLGSWVIPGSMCAVLYLVMSLPLSALARRLEQRWKASTA